MSYVDKNLIPGESALYRTGLHWIVLVWPMFWALSFGVLGLAFLVISVSVRVNPPGSAAIAAGDAGRPGCRPARIGEA